MVDVGKNWTQSYWTVFVNRALHVDVADIVGFGRISVSTFVEESYFDFGKQSVLICCIEFKGIPSSGVTLCN